MTAVLRRSDLTASAGFGFEAAVLLLSEMPAPWVQELGLVVETVECERPAGAADDWQPGARLRLPFGPKICRDGGAVASQAIVALADTALMIACAAAWNGYRPVSQIDQTVHFLRPAHFDLIADARIIRIGRANTFGRVLVSSATDRRPVGMVSSAYAML